MPSDVFPVAAERPIPDELRERGVDFLQGLLADGKVDLDRFQVALHQLLTVTTEADFAAVVRSLPPPVDFTPPARRRQEPFIISTSMGKIRLEGRWQVSRQTKIRSGMGAVTVDLREAEFDDWDVEIVIHTSMGAITVIAPRGLDVRLVGLNSAIKSTTELPLPVFPVVRLSATSDMGTVRVMHQPEQAQPRERWRRRRRPAS
jgi:hypothetical protein